jgi:hypothetical protein
MKYVFAVLISLFFILPGACLADVTYSYTADFSSITGIANSTISWSFDEPTFLTANTTVTSFSSSSLGAGFASCGTITDVIISNPTSSTPSAETDWSTPCDGGFVGAASFFHSPLTADGTYAGFTRAGVAENATLTISGVPAAAVPEPSAFLLMLGGVSLSLIKRSYRR